MSNLESPGVEKADLTHDETPYKTDLHSDSKVHATTVRNVSADR